MIYRSWLPLALAVSFLTAANAADEKSRNVWDGVFTSAQAGRGLDLYLFKCARCHGEDLTGSGNVLRGRKFMDQWREDHVKNLFGLIKLTMPRGAPGSLGDAQYIDIVAYLLQANGFPEGSSELTLDGSERVAITTKEGPQPVPDFALVTVVGCLMPGPAPNTWKVIDASEPVRTRNPRESTQEELATAAARPAGDHIFGFMDTINFPEQLHAGRWVEGKGLLIRAPGNDRINLTWLGSIAEECRKPSKTR